MNCPRCRTVIERVTAPDGVVVCPGCGARLVSRAAAQRQGAAKNTRAPATAAAAAAGPRTAAAVAEAPRPAPPAAEPPRSNGLPAEPPLPSLAEHPPSATLPPTPAMLLGLRGHSAPAGNGEAPDVVLRPPATAPDAIQDTLDVILAELRSLREAHERLLQHLEQGAPALRSEPSADEGEGEHAEPALRARRRKSVLLIDDDARTREAAVAQLRQADVPVRAYDEGNAALSGIAEEKPDVIVLELGLGGDMAGKDVINMIKATMEWVDIPIVLWTREAVSNQREARQIHGADEVVPKSAGAAALVTRVVTVFRRG